MVSLGAYSACMDYPKKTFPVLLLTFSQEGKFPSPNASISHRVMRMKKESSFDNSFACLDLHDFFGFGIDCCINQLSILIGQLLNLFLCILLQIFG